MIYKYLIFASYLSVAFAQSCVYNDGLVTQMQAIQSIALNQQTQLANLAYAQTWDAANGIAVQLQQMNTNLANQMIQLQNAYTSFPNCVYNGYPWGYYGYGALSSYYGYQQAFASVNGAIYANTWDYGQQQAYVNQMQAANQALLQQAQQAQWALAPPSNWRK